MRALLKIKRACSLGRKFLEDKKMKNIFNALIQFRNKLYNHLPCRADALMDLFDALSSYGHKCKSVVELSEAPVYKRQYSSITDSITNGADKIDFCSVEKEVFNISAQKNDVRFFLDCTNNKRAYSPHLEDRSIVHYSNPAPGNKPVCVGHQYSMLALQPQDEKEIKKHWVIPISMKRVKSDMKGNEFGMEQLFNTIENLELKDKLTSSVGDSLYGTENCRKASVKNKNHVHIFRIRNNRKLFNQPDEHDNPQKKLGRRKVYGKPIKLSDSSSLPTPKQKHERIFENKHGATRKAVVQQWDDILMSGSKKFDSHNHPVNLIQATLYDENHNPIFKNPLWIGVIGERKNEFSTFDIYDGYRSRYDVEHFFRYGKQKLLLNSYQTPDVDHEENWWQLVMLSYVQLYLANKDSNLLPKPWERYLPEYKNVDENQIATPSQVQRNFENILSLIGTPSIPPIPRGNPKGREEGQLQPKRQKHDIIFKEKKKPNDKKKTNNATNDKTPERSNHGKIEDLIASVSEEIKSFNISPEQFSNMLTKVAT